MKKASLFLLAGILASTQALAHLETGVHEGQTEAGAPCSMLVVSHYYDNGFRHPLNERAQVAVGDQTFTVYHPPVVNRSEPSAYFNHDVFEGVAATRTGARALVIDMDHSEGADGPTGFQFIDDNWREKTRTSLNCRNLKLAQ